MDWAYAGEDIVGEGEVVCEFLSLALFLCDDRVLRLCYAFNTVLLLI